MSEVFEEIRIFMIISEFDNTTNPVHVSVVLRVLNWNPYALFESTLMMNAPPKTALAEGIWSMLSPVEKSGPSASTAHRLHYVLDGGAPLHRVQWPKGTPIYRDVFSVYCSYVRRKYDAATIVFDGYDEVSTKCTTQK